MPLFYLLGDPAQRLLVPKLSVHFDSISGRPDTGARQSVPALELMRLSGTIRSGSNSDAPVVSDFSGTVTITLYDAPTTLTATTSFSDDAPYYDSWVVDGPILYRGTARVSHGRFTASFIVPKDVKLDTAAAKLSGYAWSVDARSALRSEEHTSELQSH